MSDTFFGKGITVASGFDLGAKTPLDSRLVANTFDELIDHVQNNRAYEGMIVYVISDKTTYQYTGKEWIIFGESSDGGSGATFVIIDNLNSLLTNASLSANQGRILREMIETLQGNYYTKQEIDEIKSILENKDLEILDKFNTISEYFPTKLSYFENDTNFITQNDLDEALADIEFVVSGSNIHIDSNEPSSKKVVWIDTSTPSNLTIVNYDERIKLKYIEMLNLTKVKLSNLGDKLDLIERNINKISSDNADKISIFKSTLGSTKSQISVLILQIENLISKETIEKEESKELRKRSKTLLYSLSDFNDEVMRVLDNELKLNISGGDSDDNDDIQTDGASLLTEDGFVLLTEDGLMVLADGVATSTILADAILTELGLAILTEDGKQILKG